MQSFRKGQFCKMAMRHILLALLFAAFVRAQEVEYRLPKNFVPVSYEIELTVLEQTFTGEDNKFEGRVKIQINRVDNTNSNELKLHSSFKYISINSLKLNETEITEENYSVDNVTDILTVNLQDIDTGEEFSLEIEYRGTHGDDMYGFYLSNYLEGENKKYLVTTQFQPTHARRAFPCFDEPEFKATFQITINLPENLNLTAISNTESTKKGTKIQFKETVEMSTYLIAFIVSEFTCDQSDVNLSSVPHYVCSRQEMQSSRQLALEDGPKILTKLSEYTALDYNNSMSKLHQYAIPDFSAGAMENWGLVTYRETALLWDEKESTNRYKQRVATVIAHELAHQWFGNLVTTRWWDTTFLNEGFATLFEFFTTNEVHPDWELLNQFVLEEHQVALETDSLITAKALKSEASSPSEVSGKFDTISYSKGGSILRMVQHFMGFDSFREGLHNYLEERRYNYTEPEILWEHLQLKTSELPVTLKDIMNNWVNKNGYPLITVTLNDSTVYLKQERFVFGDSGNETAIKWYVPISFTQSNQQNKFYNTKPDLWLTPDADESINLKSTDAWIILNNQATGFYRVNYDETLWNRIAEALKKDNFDGIHELNRAQIVDDIFALTKTGKMTYGEAFKILEFLKNDTSYYSWYSAFSGFNYLQRRVGTESELGQAVVNHIKEWIGKLFESVPISELKPDNQIYTHKQVLTLGWACKLGISNCTEEVKTQFKQYRLTKERPSPNLRSLVYCYGLRASDDKEDWEFLWQEYTNTTIATEQITILNALGCTEDVDLIHDFLNKSIDSPHIRAQDKSSVFSAVYTGSAVGITEAFNFLVDNHKRIEESYSSMNALGNIVRGIAERFTSQEQISQLESLIKSLDEGTTFRTAAESALKTAQANLEWVELHRNELHEYYQNASTSTSSSSSTTSTQTPVPTSTSTSTPASTSSTISTITTQTPVPTLTSTSTSAPTSSTNSTTTNPSSSSSDSTTTPTTPTDAPGSAIDIRNSILLTTLSFAIIKMFY